MAYTLRQVLPTLVPATNQFLWRSHSTECAPSFELQNELRDRSMHAISMITCTSSCRFTFSRTFSLPSAYF